MKNTAYTFPKKTIRDIPVHGKTILVRADFNVPLSDDGEIQSDFRITQTIPTLTYLLERKCRVIVVAHLGRPEGAVNKVFSLQPVAQRLRELLAEYSVDFCESTTDDQAWQACKNTPAAGLLLLENLRFNPGEEANSTEFAQSLVRVSGADYFVQDGFGVVHRAHASTEAITHLLPSVSGLLLEKEVTILEKAMLHPRHPLVAVVGGAKISDKIGFVERLLTIADTVLIGGAMANTFLKYQGNEIGLSKVEVDQDQEIATILQKAQPDQIVFPKDVVTTTEIAINSQSRTCHVNDVKPNEYILDLGPQTMVQYKELLTPANTVIWNGTLGMAEMPDFAKASESLAADIALEQHGVETIVGGGDTADFALDWLKQNPDARFSHISTGGGAGLELMSGMKLPGVEALLPR